MAKFVFGMNVSLDGYVDHQEMRPPDRALFRHWIEHVRNLTGSIYGRRVYEAMRYWDEDHPEWDADRQKFAVAWRTQPKWVVSSSLKSVGPNATLVGDDVETAMRTLKVQQAGEIAVAGPTSALSMSIASTSAPLYWGAARPSLLAPGRRFASWPATQSARTP